MLKLLFWVLALPLLVFVIVFAASNPAPVTLNLWPFTQIDVPLYSIALVGALVGILLGAVISWAQGSRTRRRLREAMHDLEAERRQLLGLREKVAQLEATEQQATIPVTPASAA